MEAIRPINAADGDPIGSRVNCRRQIAGGGQGAAREEAPHFRTGDTHPVYPLQKFPSSLSSNYCPFYKPLCDSILP